MELMMKRLATLVSATLVSAALGAGGAFADSTSTPSDKAVQVTAVIAAFDAQARSVTLTDGSRYVLGAGLSTDGFIVGDKVMLTINREDNTIASVDEAE
jgi:Cu/Ag efflux protein CusF